MDLAKIKAKLAALTQDKTTGAIGKENFWRPDFGKHQIRIVPSMYDPSNPFTELYFHTSRGFSDYPVLALSNFGKQDPVEEFIRQLRLTSNKENWSLSGKLNPRPRYIVPVIVRGEEDKGVRLWNIGATIYKALLQLAADDEIGDFTDVTNGTDIIVEKVKSNNLTFPSETTIRPKRSSSLLSENAEEVDKWLKEQPKPVDCFRHYQYDEVKSMLEKYLSGGGPVSTPNPVARPVEEDRPVSEPKPGIGEEAPSEMKPKKQDTSKKFDDLFGDDDELPFS